MKKTSSLFLHIGINLLILISCCKKDSSIFNDNTIVLPEVSDEGKNTFGCLINGDVWAPFGYKTVVKAEYYPWNDSPFFYGTLSIKVTDNINKKGMNITLGRRVFGTGKYLVFDDKNNYNYLIYNDDFNSKYFHNSNIDSYNYIEVNKLDTINRIVSGKFRINLINNIDQLDTLKLREGRFDFRY